VKRKQRSPAARHFLFLFALLVATSSGAQSTGNTSPATNSVNTPRPFDPVQNTTNPSAFAVQTQNPFLGSVPTGALVPGVMPLSLRAAVDMALHANLGYIDSEQEHAQSRAARIRALSVLLPQLAAKDRFDVGVSNTVDLIQAQQAIAEAEDNRIASVYAHQFAKLLLIRATGTAEQDYINYLGVR